MNKAERKEYNRKWSETHPNYRKEWRAKHPEYVAKWAQAHRDANPGYAAEKTRNYKLAHPGQHFERVKAYIEANPEKRKAHIAVLLALRAGKIERLPCEVCKDARSQAHHPDYSKPLEIEWLCAKHHKQKHRTI